VVIITHTNDALRLQSLPGYIGKSLRVLNSTKVLSYSNAGIIEQMA